MKRDMDFLKKSMEQLSVDITETQLEQFYIYYELLVEKNKVMNLTAITDFDEVVEKHFLDSLSLVKILKLKESLSILDMGTGAGFPGIPLKIVYPELEVTLMDSLQKRVLFLQEVTEKLKLSNIRSIHGRAEEIAFTKEHREHYDLCVSRAVANLATLSEYCIPFVKVGGQFISYKSSDCEKEVAGAKNAIFLLGGKIRETYKFSLGELGRAFVIIDKVKHTSGKYPRKAGTPSRNPL